ncbi:MAG: substrate-binding domain-containing protein, partial [Chloroflexia bacterium]|nr:substrate-binding domain-containing protein [Chloroflexia bacterium]
PALTTMRQATQELGALAASLLIEALATSHPDRSAKPARHLLRAQLVERASVRQLGEKSGLPKG